MTKHVVLGAVWFVLIAMPPSLDCFVPRNDDARRLCKRQRGNNNGMTHPLPPLKRGM
jgi:hypothetical protein